MFVKFRILRQFFRDKISVYDTHFKIEGGWIVSDRNKIDHFDFHRRKEEITTDKIVHYGFSVLFLKNS
jgi:Ser-tRNA(Ala) deacylase AlaX